MNGFTGLPTVAACLPSVTGSKQKSDQTAPHQPAPIAIPMLKTREWNQEEQNG
jgi:hypothetical protein